MKYKIAMSLYIYKFNTITISILILIPILYPIISKAQNRRAEAVTCSPYPIKVPNGSDSIEIIAKGGLEFSYTLTSKERLLVIQDEDGEYKYATRNKVSGEIEPSAITAIGDVDSRQQRSALRDRSKSVELITEDDVQRDNIFRDKFIRSNAHEDAQIQQPFRSSSATNNEDALPLYQLSRYNRIPVEGDIKVLCLLIEFPDIPAKYSKDDFQRQLTEHNYNNTGSFKDYFKRASYDKLSIDTDVHGWYKAKYPHTHYGNSNSEAAAMDLVIEAVEQAVEDGVDLSQYDNDNNSTIDAIMIIHSGRGAEEAGQNQYIWSHNWQLSRYSKQKFYDGKIVNNYCITPETRRYNASMTGIGIVCHEFAHFFGLPDLYDTTFASNGIGNWGLMGTGSWLGAEAYPADLTAFSKYLLNWIDLEILDKSGEYTIPPSSETDKAYILQATDENANYIDGEFFLLSNRQKSGTDILLPGSGLAIWHIDMNTIKLNSDVDDMLIELEQADNNSDLRSKSNRGDDGDVYPFDEDDWAYTNDSEKNCTFCHNTLPSNLAKGLAESSLSKYSIDDIEEVQEGELQMIALKLQYSDNNFLGDEAIPVEPIEPKEEQEKEKEKEKEEEEKEEEEEETEEQEDAEEHKEIEEEQTEEEEEETEEQEDAEEHKEIEEEQTEEEETEEQEDTEEQIEDEEEIVEEQEEIDTNLDISYDSMKEQIDNTKSEESKISFFPIPLRTEQLSFDLPSSLINTQLTVSIISLSGVTIYRRDITPTSTRYMLDHKSFRKGIYIVQVINKQTAELIKSEKLTII